MTNELTKEALYTMLTERVGESLCDSGKELGYAYEKNRREYPPERDAVKFTGHELEVEKSLFHFLLENLEFDKLENDLFIEFIKENDLDEGFPGVDLFYDWFEYLKEKGYSKKVRGDLFDHDALYSYNYVSCLDQEVTLGFYTKDWTEYALVASHNGADARGGMAFPKVFKILNKTALIGFGEASAECANCGARWRTEDNGSNWTAEGEAPEMPCEVIYVEEEPGFSHLLEHDLRALVRDHYFEKEGEPERVLKREVVVSDTETRQVVYCPHCGEDLTPGL